MAAAACPEQHHFGELDAAHLAFICIYAAEGPFQSHKEPCFQTVISYMRGHSCARPAAKWTGMCRLSRPWRTGLWALSLGPRRPNPPPPLPACPDLSQHHHLGLSPGVQLASAEWIDGLTWPWEVCAWARMFVRVGGGGSVGSK